MTDNHCHQSCESESPTQLHSHTKLRTFRSTTKAILLTTQSLAFYSNRVMAVDLGQSHFLWASSLIMFFQMKCKYFKHLMILHKISVFFKLDCYAFPVKVCILNQLQLQCSPYQKIKGLLECLPDFSCFISFTFQCFKSVTYFVVQEWYPLTTAVHLRTPTLDSSSA